MIHPSPEESDDGWFPHLAAYVAGRLTAIFGMGTCSYADACAMAYDEFSAWCAFLTHYEFHRDDTKLQAEHDDVMAAAAAAARG